MRKDPTEFRRRFAAWKDGKMPYEAGLPKYEGGKSIHESFVELMGPSLYNELYKRGIADIDSVYNNMMRQLAGESTYGTSKVARENNNFGGVGFTGKDYTKYDSVQSFIKDYVDLIQNRYSAAMGNITPAQYASVLKKGGYYQAPEAEYVRTMSNMPTLQKYMIAHRKAHPDMYGEVKTPYPMRTSIEYDDPKPQSILDSKPSYSQPSYGSTYKGRLYPVKTVQLPEVVITGDKEKSKFALPTIADMIKPQPYSEYMRDYFQQILGVPKLYAPHQLMQ